MGKQPDPPRICLHIVTPAALSFNLSGVDEYLNCSTLVAWCHMLVVWEVLIDCFNWRALLYFHYDSFDVVSMFNAMMVFNKCFPFETFFRCSISILEWRILLPCKAPQGFQILSPVGKTPYKCSCFVSMNCVCDSNWGEKIITKKYFAL